MSSSLPAGDQLVVRGSNAHFFTYTRIRSRETGENRKTNEQTKLGVNQEQRKVCNTTCMCIPDSRYGLTLAWVTSKNSTMLLESDILRLFFTGPYLMLPRFSARCLVLTAPPFFHANFSSAACLSALQPPTASLGLLPPTLSAPVQLPTAFSLLSSHQLSSLLSNYQLPLLWVASSTLIRLPVPLPGTARFHVQESFVWFRAKTDSSALAAFPHSATSKLIAIPKSVEYLLRLNKYYSRQRYEFESHRVLIFHVIFVSR